MKIIYFALLALALAGCGGSANTGSNGTGDRPPPTDPTVASGPLTSLGPLGVAGTELTDAGAQVLLNSNAARPAGDLRLGMLADADGLVAPSTGTGVTNTVVAQSLVVGPVTTVDAARQGLRVLGLPVRVDQNTLLDGIARLDQVGVGDWVEVYGLRLPHGAGTLATRLVVRTPTQDRSVEVLGTASEVGASSIVTQGLRIELGSAQVSLASPSGVQLAPPGASTLTAGTLVRVQGTYDAASGVVTATAVTTGFGPSRPEGKLVYVEGFVLEQGAGMRFRVGDLEVDTAGVGTALSVGMRVRLRGRMQAGVLRVDQVTEVGPAAQVEYAVEGAISEFRSVADFSLRGERIDASQALFHAGTAALLGDGRRVRVKGVAGPGRISATEVTILGD